uniref:Reverse transcriptase domain-containing protein n=1 Tax=Schistocephalus solidus TaxID=70667 RepID=A0A0X3PXH1_SCHSO
MIMGDFNAPGINWSTVQSSCPKSTFDYVFLQKTLNALLTQHVPFPTRTREGQRANCLDLVFTKTSGSIDEIISMPPLGRSDHVVLMWDYSLFSVAPAIEEKRRNVWRGNFHQMRADITHINWTSIFSSTVNEDWESFRNVLLQLIDNHCPLTSVHHSKRPGWLDSNLKREINRKHKLWRKYCESNQVAYFNKYKAQRNKMRSLILKTRREFEKTLLQKATQNPKLVYSYLRRCTRNKHQIPLIKTAVGVEISENREKAEYFSQFYRSVFTNEARFLRPSVDNPPTASISHILFSEFLIQKELKELKESKSPGPDELPPKLLKELANELSAPLSVLFQKSFDSGTLPFDWKLAHITPLYKSGSRASVTNYRPISLTCILGKIMERIIKSELVKFLETHNLLSSCQHGFRKGRSCTTNLLYSIQRWTQALEDRHAVHIAFIDFQKAFDTVPHERLLYKLERIGIRGNLLKWIENFLVGRRQVVCIGQERSSSAAVESGVPQGSVLGPILFLIYVNDCVRNLDCEAAMFADDIKIWNVIQSPADEDKLQINLTRLEEWSNHWLLRFNVDKCTILRLGNPSGSAESRSYFLNGEALKDVETQKDLGVLMTTTLKPSSHCSKVAKRAISVLHAIRRAFLDFDEDLFAKTFGTFIRPHLEYAMHAWKPWTVQDQNCLERVQRKATKMVRSQSSLPYPTRLIILNLFPLSYRQMRGDLLQTFRIVKGLDCCLEFSDFFEFATTTHLRGHPLKLRVQQARLDVRKFSFSVRVVKPWNALPEDVVMSPSLESFKRNLDSFMFRNEPER